MSNPFFSALGGGKQAGGFPQLVRQFQQFRQTFKGDPKAKVEKLVQSGKLSQQQLNQFQEMAKQFQNLM